MTSTPATPPTPLTVFGGADTHADTIHLAAIDALGRELGDREFPTSREGYQAALEFLTGFGLVEVFGIEGTSSYGAGLARTATDAGLVVVEVNRPDRAHRRRRGKSDPIDAYQAAHAAASGRATAAPKHEAIDAIRALHNARNSAVKATTAAMNQIHQLLVTAPVEVRERYRDLREKSLLKALAAARPHTSLSTWSPTARTVLGVLRTLARRHQHLTAEADDLQAQLRELVTAVNPGLLAAHGLGPITAAQLLITAGGNPDRLRSEASFAAPCGTAPVPASTGKTTRHRLSRGGDRAANCALHTIALVRLANDPRTRQWPPVNAPLDVSASNCSASSNAPSPARCTATSPSTSLCPKSPTYDHCASPRTSPSPQPQTTSASGQPSSAPSNEAPAATTTSQTPTANGSSPLDRP